MQLSTNFALWEFEKSSTADRLDIDNTVIQSLAEGYEEDVLLSLKALCVNIAEPLRAHFGKFSPSSGFRSYALERVLCAPAIERFLMRGGASVTERDYLEKKQHPTGKAMDFEFVGHRNIDVARWIEKNLDFDQLILEFYREDDPRAGWIHVSYDGKANRNQVLTIGRDGTKKGLPPHELPKQTSRR
jgi:hypothetical protein